MSRTVTLSPLPDLPVEATFKECSSMGGNSLITIQLRFRCAADMGRMIDALDGREDRLTYPMPKD